MIRQMLQFVVTFVNEKNYEMNVPRCEELLKPSVDEYLGDGHGGVMSRIDMDSPKLPELVKVIKQLEKEKAGKPLAVWRQRSCAPRHGGSAGSCVVDSQQQAFPGNP